MDIANSFRDNLAVTILRHFCRELRINGNTVSIMVAC